MALKRKYGDKMDFIVADVDKEQTLAARYQVYSIPAIYFLDKQGNIVENSIGYLPQDQLEKQIEEFVNAPPS